MDLGLCFSVAIDLIVLSLNHVGGLCQSRYVAIAEVLMQMILDVCCEELLYNAVSTVPQSNRNFGMSDISRKVVGHNLYERVATLQNPPFML